nr:unnamed protein product [Callosobruchus chinensis]
MESQFKALRKNLDDLGYTQALRIECIPLVNKLLSDLKTTTENLRKYMTISKNALDLENRNQEIQRLSRLSEGVRPVKAHAQDFDNIDKKITALQDEICALKADRSILAAQLKGALAKQHEAMRRALHLAERNKQLEKEMKDIDQIALQVEAELKQEKMSIQADLDAVKLEKRQLQSSLQFETEDKKALTDRINNLTMIEHDLNMEIDRLVRLTGEQKLRIAELEGIKRRSNDVEVQRRYDELLKKIEERNQTIIDLHQEIKTLSDSKYKATSKLASQRDSFENGDNCLKACCKRKQRELQLYRDEVQQLQRENDSLKSKIQKAFQDMEEHIRNLEDERRNMVVNQLSSRTHMTQLEEDCHVLKDKLRSTQNELNTQKASYEQLKNLHEQSNLALMESRRQLAGSERELQSVHSKMSNSHRETAGQEREISRLQNDNVVDEKTEKIENLEGQLAEKRNIISTLESELKAMKQKLRRLQDDLAIALADCKNARKELDLCSRQIDDLKRQLQHYVAEVKRFEDQISQKELERAEILDQFRNLSAEASNLETTNHTLENEAAQSKVQLSVALDHASDLERKLDNKDAIIRSYEKQIADMSSKVASLEIQLKQRHSQYEKIDDELRQMKDLCVQLDREKDELRIELRNWEDHKGVAQRNIEKLSKENDDLKRAFKKDKDNVEDLEKLLDDARQEVIRQKLINQDLQTELTRLEVRLKEVQEGLIPNPPRNLTTQEPSPQRALKNSQSVQCQTDFHRNQENQMRRRELLNIQISDLVNIADTAQRSLRELQGVSVGTQTLQYTNDIIKSKETTIGQSGNSEATGFRSVKKTKSDLKQALESKSIPTPSPNSTSNTEDIDLTTSKTMIHGLAGSSNCFENTQKISSSGVKGANNSKPAQSTKLPHIPLHFSDDATPNIQKRSKEHEVSSRCRDYNCCKCAKCDCCKFCKGKFFEKETFAKFKESKKHKQDNTISDTDGFYTGRRRHTSKPNEGTSKKCSEPKDQAFMKADKDSDSLEELRQSKENRPCDADIYKINISRTERNVPLKYVKNCTLNVRPLVISNIKSASFPSHKFMTNIDGESVAQKDKNCESSTTSTLMIEGPDMSCRISNRKLYCSTAK